MKEFLVIFFLISALFWGILHRDYHVNIFTKFFNLETPPQILFISISVLCFIAAVFISQEDYFKTIYNCSKNVAQSGGRIVKATSKLISSTANNFESFDDFADTVESMVEGATL